MRAHLTMRLLAAATLGVAAPAAAQDSPTDVAATFFTAIAEERWRDAARLLDLAAFDRYRRERISAARLPQPRPRVITAEELMRHDPDMPREVAEYQARKAMEASRQSPAWLEIEFADVVDVDSLAALSAEESAARWLRARDLRWAIERAARRERERGCVLPPESARARFPVPSHEIVGSVISDSTTAYVLHRRKTWQRAEPDPDAAVHAEPPHILTLRRRKGVWRILPRQAMLERSIGVSFVSAECPPGARPPR